MPRIDNKKFYSSAIKKFGETAQGVHWISEENQSLRFDEISKFLPADMSPYSLADAGCGFGDFYLYLRLHQRIPKVYIGLDIHSQMCSIARKRTAQQILQADICKDILPIQDYYVCSGALNILTEFETHLFILNCYNSSKKAFIFNLLCANKKSETYNYLSKKQIEAIAQKLQVKKLVYSQSYIENDITVMFCR